MFTRKALNVIVTSHSGEHYTAKVPAHSPVIRLLCLLFESPVPRQTGRLINQWQLLNLDLTFDLIIFSAIIY